MSIGFLSFVGFVIVGLVGLLAALRPTLVIRYFLAEWQRQRLTENETWLSRTGWIIFGCCMFTAVAMLLQELLQR